MDHYEMVENLRTKANVTYEEAKAALEASDWDMVNHAAARFFKTLPPHSGRKKAR